MIEIRKDALGDIAIARVSRSLRQHLGLIGGYLAINLTLQNQNRLAHLANRRQRIVSQESISSMRS